MIIAVGSRVPRDVLDVLQLAGTDVEQGADAVDVDTQALGDELVVGAQGSQRQPEAVGPRELVESRRRPWVDRDGCRPWAPQY